MKITSINLNGIRAAVKRGFLDWIAVEDPDVLLMQEVRADTQITEDILGQEWLLATEPCRIKGRAGVAIAVRRGRATLDDVRAGLGDADTDVDSGRWIEGVVTADSQSVRVVSAYFHSGEKDTPKQEAKMAHLPRIGERMAEILASGEKAVVCGDYNVVRSRQDIKNWTPNHNKRAGVLDEEIVFLNDWVDTGWHDVVRDLAGDVQGPYTWWSWRGKAFDNDTGWRIDYHYATPTLASTATAFAIGRAQSYDQRFSDHAPLTVTYQV